MIKRICFFVFFITFNTHLFALTTPFSSVKSEQKIASENEITTTISFVAGVTGNDVTEEEKSGTFQLGLLAYNPEKYYVSGIFLKGNETEITSDSFGSIILTPEASQGLVLNSYLLPYDPYTVMGFPFLWGPYGSVCISKVKFKSDVDSSGTPAELEVNGDIYALAVGLITTRVFMLDKNQVEAGIQGGYSCRIIGGNFANDKELREGVFNLNQKFINCPEIILFLRINEIRAFGKITYAITDNYIDDLSELQFNVGVDIMTDIKLKEF